MGSAPCVISASATFLVCTILRSAAPTRVTISAGVPVGAIIPNQVLVSKPGMPDSAMVGSEGAAALRFALLMASACSLPELTYGSTDNVFANIICTWPAMRSVTAGGVPL